MKIRHSSTFVRMGLAAVLTGAIAIGVLPVSPIAQAALGGLTPFEIDGNTVPEDPTNLDWTNKGNVTVENDYNYTGAETVPTDVANDGTAPPFVANCPSTGLDSVFNGGTAIDDPDWTDDTRISNVVNSKTDLCQSFFAFDVVQTGPSAGHVIAYIGVTRSDINGDASYFFVLSHGPTPTSASTATS